MKTRRKKLTQFVSNIDEYCADFDRSHPLSESQIAEIKKYKHIYQLRDGTNPQSPSEDELA